MRWSWQIARVRGIPVYVHFTFLLLLVWVILEHYLRDYKLGEAVRETLFVALVFGIIVLHELGHALAAARYGIATRDITLYPIGGLSRLERMPDDPRQELVVALAGPAVNVALAALAFVGMAAMAEFGSAARPRLVEGALLPRLFWVNVGLVLFNLLPAFPMDGGRVLRALLALRMDYARATQAAATVGQGMALLFGFGGLYIHNPLLVFIALFVWIGAAQEAHLVQTRSALAGIPVAEAMVRDFQALSPGEPLGAAARHALAGFQQDFPVVENGRLVGFLTRADLLAALVRQGEAGRVGDVMQREFKVARAAEMLDAALARLRECNCHALPVIRGEEVVGLLAPENVGEFLMFQSAVRRPPPAEQGRALAQPPG
jgi:Zn-dependent protease